MFGKRLPWAALLLLLLGASACDDMEVMSLVQGEEVAVFQGLGNFGSMASGAGDVNGDGFPDFLVGESNNRVFLIFGRNASQWAATASTLNVFASPSADPSQYVAIQPRAGCDHLGDTALSFGDINGDGFSDILLGGQGDYGCGFAIYGHGGAWDALVIAGEAPGLTFSDFVNTGQYPSGCGDINGDGIDDVFVGARTNFPFVVFGAREPNTAHRTVARSSLNGDNGFYLANYDNNGGDFSYGIHGRAGDVNGDGIDDLLVGHFYHTSAIATNGGRAYVFFGRSTWNTAFSVASNIDGIGGFVVNPLSINYLYMGRVAMGAGDINHDGFADIFLGTNKNRAVFVFGHGGTWTSSISASALNGKNGFILQGTGGDTEFFGYSGGPAGDVNGDHVDDLVISDYNAENGAIRSGAAWVLYGHRGDWPSWSQTLLITGSVGFKIAGTDSNNDDFGFAAIGAGDVNRDGLSDIIIGAKGRSGGAGEAFLIFSNVVEGCLDCNETGFCMRCAQGFFLEADGTCTDCSLTNTWSVNDTETCQTCAVGDCLECDAGSGICTKCPAGMEPNTTAQLICQECSSTQFSPDGTQCDACLLGFGCISCNAINGLCVECPAGMHLDGVSCEDCGDMQWSAGGSAATCSACQVDATCEECDSRTGHCTSCPVAYGLADSGCTACGATQFSDGKHACAACELQDGCSACNRTTGMCVACPAGTGLQGVGCVACTPTRFVVNGYCAECALDDGCIACDPVTGACVDCPGDMVPTGTGCKPFEVASNATKDDDDNVSMAAKPTTNALHLIASIIVSAIAAAAMAAF